MNSIITFLLPVAILAIIHTVAPTQDGNALSGNSHRHSPLALLRKRSFEAAPRGPPTSSFLSDSLVNSARKRSDDDGEYWIWMPAHGYLPVPKNEPDEEEGDRDSLGTLLRYG